MKIKILKNLTLLLFAVVFFACNSSNNKYSRTTGWRYNDNKAGTGFEFQDKEKTSMPDGMVFIDGGSFTIGEKSEFVTAPRNNERRRVSVSPFYMDKYEIRNIDWREYTHWMELVFGKVAPELVRKSLPDKKVWQEELAYNEPYLEFYFMHPSYNNYPVVGVTWEQAMDYCEWRTDRTNELFLINAGILAQPDFRTVSTSSDFEFITKDFVFNTQKYLLQDSYRPNTGKSPVKDLNNNIRKVTMGDGVLIQNFRLPTESEWEYAAYAIKEGSEGFSPEGKLYPWGGMQFRDKKGKNGGLQANFVRGRGDYVGSSKNISSKATITAPVDSYKPNDFGLYNMSGNVNEWVLDVYRSTSFGDVEEYNSFRGNLFLEPVISQVDENGVFEYKIDSLGRIEYQVQKNGDVRDFKDGDGSSFLETDYQLFASVEGEEYLREKENVKIDVTDVLAPKITNKTRVYKGGSWKDRGFWLNPSTRRYLDQDKSSNDIGFRCAMSVVGDKRARK